MAELGQLGVPYTVAAKSPPPELDHFVSLAQAHGATMALIGRERLDRKSLEQLPKLKFIAKYGVGLDNLDDEACADLGISIGWTGGVNRRSVAELVLAFSLMHCRNVEHSMQLLRRGIWEKNGGRQLSQCRFGIVGFGHIGQDLASLLRPLGCEIFYNDILDKSIEARQLGARRLDYESLLATCDIISFHVPSTAATRPLFAGNSIALCRPQTLIINTARGDIVDFAQVTAAVLNGQLGGYAADVFPVEPCQLDALMSQSSKLYFTPHIGGNAREAVLAMGRAALAHLRGFLTA